MGLGGVAISQQRKQRMGRAAVARAAHQANRQTQREWFFPSIKALCSVLQVARFA